MKLRRISAAILAVMMAAVLALSIAGCGSTDPKALLKQAQDNMNGLDAASITANIDMDFAAVENSQKDSVALHAVMEMDVKDSAIHMAMTGFESAGGPEKLEAYMIPNADKTEYVVYSGITEKGKTAWEKSSAEMQTALNPDQMQEITAQLTEVLDEAIEYENGGSESVNGKDTYIIKSNIDLMKLLKAIADSGITDQVDPQALSMVEFFLKDVKIPLTFNVEKENVRMTRVTIDIKPVFDQLMGTLMPFIQASGTNANIEINEFKMTMTFTKLGEEVEDIVVPNEVKQSAKTVESGDAATTGLVSIPALPLAELNL